MFIKTYSNLSIKTPDCLPGVPIWSASFTTDVNIEQLFPYINAVAENARYYEKPHCILFFLDGIRCALYPNNAVVTPFQDRKQATDFIEKLIAFLNDLDNRKNTIKPNHKKYKPIPVLEIFKRLPQTNCRKCNYATCMAFAVALSKGETFLDQCPDLEDVENEKKLKSILF